MTDAASWPVQRAGSGMWLRFGLRNLTDWIVSTVREAGLTQAPGIRKLVQEWAVTMLMFLFVTTTMVQAYVVPTGSMEDNILVGDHMLVDKVGFENGGNNWASYVLPHREVKRGDIIAFRYPEDVRQTYVKRVIGVPGDRIRLREQAGDSQRAETRRAIRAAQQPGYRRLSR